MRIAKSLGSSWLLIEIALVLLLGSLSIGSASAQAPAPQPPCMTGQGFNGAYTQCNGSNNPAVLNGSFAFIDAAQYMSSGDICQAINTILGQYIGGSNGNSQGVVVDARGFNSGTTQNCSANPWVNVNLPVTNTVILLPSGTISLIPDKNNKMPTWTLNKNTLLLGQGPNVTVIQASSSFTGDMIRMGDNGLPCGSAGNCPAIQIEHLGLVGNNNVSNGIANQYSGELSDVKDVAIANIPAGTGLYLTNDAGNSGPYSNITMSNVGTCVNINGLTGTRGIHGLTCTTAASSTAKAAILIDGSNNSIEDVYITQGGNSLDGILIGYNANAQGNLLFNVTGVGLKNVIELSSAGAPPNVSDITILGVTKSGTGGTIKDGLTGGSTITDANVGMYVLGGPVQQNTSGTPSTIGYSRFSTSKSANAVTWVVGPNSLSPGTACTAIGDLYSRTSNATVNTLWYCAKDHTWHSII